jgi:preprotein translocase subunit SecE
MAKDQGAGAGSRWGKKPSKGRTPQMSAGGAITADEKPAPKKRVSPAEFFRQVRAEARKITWPSRKETWITSVMVFLMILITILFFFVVDLATSEVVSYILKVGS